MPPIPWFTPCPHLLEVNLQVLDGHLTGGQVLVQLEPCSVESGAQDQNLEGGGMDPICQGGLDLVGQIQWCRNRMARPTWHGVPADAARLRKLSRSCLRAACLE